MQSSAELDSAEQYSVVVEQGEDSKGGEGKVEESMQAPSGEWVASQPA